MNVFLQVMMAIETGRHVVLVNADRIYEAMFDLMNQSFQYVDGERFCRISLGTYTTNRCVGTIALCGVISSRVRTHPQMQGAHECPYCCCG